MSSRTLFVMRAVIRRIKVILIENLKHIWGAIKSPEVIIALIIFFMALIVINGLTLVLPADNKYYSDPSFLDNMLANANTMIFDIIVLSVINTFLLKLSERRKKIQDYLDEIDDFRGWQSEEASHRIRGIILRLNKLGVTKINLIDCCLKKANLSVVNLRGANLCSADLSEANLCKTNLRGADLSSADLSGAWLDGANLSEAFLDGANLSNADFSEADLSGAHLDEVYLDSSFVLEAASGLDSANFTDAKLDNETRNFLKPINKTIK